MKSMSITAIQDDMNVDFDIRRAYYAVFIRETHHLKRKQLLQLATSTIFDTYDSATEFVDKKTVEFGVVKNEDSTCYVICKVLFQPQTIITYSKDVIGIVQ